ncbi:mitofilin family membrane protein [Boseongicola aestuarii]|uniref:mitofilin family membrane protein n=1 Tax=Boseongicola aestuarii TaxID=1470561 RepID=UPI000BB45493|nr:mitofilin family membrane protein [Boseongicola aestuarii]
MKKSRPDQWVNDWELSTLANGKNSSKVSKGKDNSPQEVEPEEEISVDENASDESESPDEAGTGIDEDDAPAPSDVESGDEPIEEAEAIAEDSELLDALNETQEGTDAQQPVVSEPRPAAPVEKGPSTFGLVFGGLLAGAIGFLVATFAVPEGWPNPPADPNEAMQAVLESQAVQIEALGVQIAGLAGTSSEVDLSSVQDDIAGLSDRFDALSARIEAIENAPAPAIVTTPAPNLDFDAEMEAFRAELEAAAAAARAEVEAAQARASQIEAEAEAAAEVAMQRAALAEVSAALESGATFSEALTILPDAPEALTSVAAEGVPTLAALRSAFPDAARNALRAVHDVPADASATDRLAAFLRKQTNARSLSPREGDDPDAVLSRAEAALNGGDLSSALSELSGLPDGAISSLADWIGQAETRAAATAAAQSLSNELN